MRKVYLGDGVYVEFDGFSLVLTTEDGINTTNSIVIEPHVFANLIAYIDGLPRPVNIGESR
jgi:hypothetical protein